MSCGYGTGVYKADGSFSPGFQCNQIYTVGGVTTQRATEWYNLGKQLGLTEFNPTSVNWDAPVPWKGEGSQIMSSGEGYGMLFGFGIGLTCITLFFSIMESKFFNVATTSEQFNTAGRSVKTGLTASVIVSQWTWAATLLQSSNVAWQYGITGPFWYAAGATIQILLFGILAIEVKRRAPNAHTFLEIIKVRWGKVAHFCFLFFGLTANLIVSAMLLLGGWCARPKLERTRPSAKKAQNPSPKSRSIPVPPNFMRPYVALLAAPSTWPPPASRSRLRRSSSRSSPSCTPSSAASRRPSLPATCTPA